MPKTLFFFPFLIALLLAVLATPLAQAQDDEKALPPSQQVEITAPDGLLIKGDYYLPATEDGALAPAVILMHMLSSTRRAWEPLIPALVNEYGIAVLNIDLRGHGETGGRPDWTLAEGDVQTIIDWLRTQEGIDPANLSLIGASIGSNLAIRGWANDPMIRTAVALSPGLDYRGVTTLDAVSANSDRALMLVAARQDTYSADSVIELFAATSGDAVLRLFDGSRHGTELFREEADWLVYSIGDWIFENMLTE